MCSVCANSALTEKTPAVCELCARVCNRDKQTRVLHNQLLQYERERTLQDAFVCATTTGKHLPPMRLLARADDETYVARAPTGVAITVRRSMVLFAMQKQLDLFQVQSRKILT